MLHVLSSLPLCRAALLRPLPTPSFLSSYSTTSQTGPHHAGRRGGSFSSNGNTSNMDLLKYLSSVVITFVGLSYAAVPLYKMFCQATGYSGAQRSPHGATDSQGKMVFVESEKQLRVFFNADVGQQINWKFTPQQKQVKVFPGETALAFYTAENLSDEEVVGIATYNINPLNAAQYFNKIQCFCFEYQRLKPREKVDMPIFFFIDPEITKDPLLKDVDTIILSYTFFAAKQAGALLKGLPQPPEPQPSNPSLAAS